MNRRRVRLTRLESSLNVTSLADVCLSLLLGFMVITPIVFQTLKATLPQGAGGGSGEVQPDPIVDYTAEKKIFLNGKEVTLEELKKKLDEFFPVGSGRKRKVMFSASGELLYDEVIVLLDELRGYGVESIGFR